MAEFDGRRATIAAAIAILPSPKIAILATRRHQLVRPAMSRRRFALRLHHSDSLLMLMAVLVATAFCWVVVAFSRGDATPTVAYTIEASGVWLSPEAMGDLLRTTLRRNPDASATVISDTTGLSIGVTPRTVANHEAAKQLADDITNRLHRTDWEATADEQADTLADQLYQVDVRIRDASARGQRTGGLTNQAKLAASLEVSRLLRRRSELLDRQTELSVADTLAPNIALRAHPRRAPLVAERWLAMAMFGVLVTAIAYRIFLGRRRVSAVSPQIAGAPTTVVTPRRRLVLAPPTDTEAPLAHQPRAA